MQFLTALIDLSLIKKIHRVYSGILIGINHSGIHINAAHIHGLYNKSVIPAPELKADFIHLIKSCREIQFSHFRENRCQPLMIVFLADNFSKSIIKPYNMSALVKQTVRHHQIVHHPLLHLCITGRKLYYISGKKIVLRYHKYSQKHQIYK